MLYFLRVPLVGAAWVLSASLGCTAARAQVGVAQSAPVAAVGVPSGAGAPAVGAVSSGATAVSAVSSGATAVGAVSGTGASAVRAVGGVQASGVNTGVLLLINQIAQGQMTLDEAWNKGLLDAPKVLQLLSQPTRLTEDQSNETLQRDLAGLLVRLAPASVAKPETLSARVRVALCRYYSSIGDARAVPLCEALIAEKLDGKQIKQPLASNPDGGSSSLYLSSVITLAQFYQNVGQWQKAGETWERALTFWQDASWWQAGVRIDAARAYKNTGTPANQSKAEQLYAQVAGFGDNWDTVMARYDHALPLMSAGKLDQAQAILSAPLPASERGEFGLIAQNAWLSRIAYQKGDLETALRLAEAAVNTGKGVALTNPSVRGLYSIAQDVYLRAGGWKTQPIQTDTQEVVFQANPSQPDKPLYARFRIKTYGDTSITATVDNPNVQARVLPLDNWQRDGLNAREEEMEVIVQTNSLQPFQNLPLVLSSQTRGKTTTVRVSLVKASV